MCTISAHAIHLTVTFQLWQTSVLDSIMYKVLWEFSIVIITNKSRPSNNQTHLQLAMIKTIFFIVLLHTLLLGNITITQTESFFVTENDSLSLSIMGNQTRALFPFDSSCVIQVHYSNPSKSHTTTLAYRKRAGDTLDIETKSTFIITKIDNDSTVELQYIGKSANVIRTYINISISIKMEWESVNHFVVSLPYSESLNDTNLYMYYAGEHKQIQKNAVNDFVHGGKLYIKPLYNNMAGIAPIYSVTALAFPKIDSINYTISTPNFDIEELKNGYVGFTCANSVQTPGTVAQIYDVIHRIKYISDLDGSNEWKMYQNIIFPKGFLCIMSDNPLRFSKKLTLQYEIDPEDYVQETNESDNIRTFYLTRTGFTEKEAPTSLIRHSPKTFLPTTNNNYQTFDLSGRKITTTVSQQGLANKVILITNGTHIKKVLKTSKFRYPQN